jgi:uncharacterized protein
MSCSSLIVADAGPLIALAKTEQLDLLAALFNTVIIPDAVADELCFQREMAGSQRLAAAIKQGFIRIQPPTKQLKFHAASVDPGEAAAISLAHELHAPLLIDDAYGRKAAKDHRVAFFGTGALLLKAKKEGIIETIRPGLDAFCQCGYRIAPALYQRLLELADEQTG